MAPKLSMKAMKATTGTKVKAAAGRAAQKTKATRPKVKATKAMKATTGTKVKAASGRAAQNKPMKATANKAMKATTGTKVNKGTAMKAPAGTNLLHEALLNQGTGKGKGSSSHMQGLDKQSYLEHLQEVMGAARGLPTKEIKRSAYHQDKDGTKHILTQMSEVWWNPETGSSSRGSMLPVHTGPNGGSHE